MHVALVQAAASLDPGANLAALADLTPEGADLVVFPEAFARDFGQPGTSVARFAVAVDGQFATAVSDQARARRTTIVAGMFEVSADPERPYNTVVVRGQAETTYRKIHLFDSFGFRESDHLTAGRPEPVTFGLGGFTVGLLTCYDVRFPELSRRLVEAGADVLVCPAAWVAGHRKVDHWLTLARARAIENTAYVVATGQCGPRYAGHSAVFDPMGDLVAGAEADPTVLFATLDPDLVAEARRTNPSLANRRL